MNIFFNLWSDEIKSMRLLLINYEFPPLGGGGGRGTAHIAQQLAKLGHEVVVLTSSFKGFPKREYFKGCLIVRIPSLRRHMEKCHVLEMVIFMISSIFFALGYVRKWKPDISIAFFTLPSGPAAFFLKKIYGVPYVVSLLGGDVPGVLKEQLWLYHRLTWRVIRRIWRGALKVTAISEGLKKMALATDPVLDIAVIPNGVDASFFGMNDAVTRDGSCHLDHKPFRILTVCRLAAEKSIETLLEACHLVKARLKKPVKVMVVGDGPHRKSLENLTRQLDLNDEVFFYGWQKDSGDLKNFYANADLFVLPSIGEGWPNVILEAMASGLPVIGSDVTGIHEIIQDGQNGILVPPRQPMQLAEKIEMLIHHQDHRAYFSRASRATSAQYKWSDAAVSYLRLCKSAL